MDELKLRLSTKFMRNMVAKIISKLIFKKLGFHVNILLNKIEVENIDGQIVMHIDVDAETTNEDFVKILNITGLV